jgi:hypothetical protein
MLLAGQHVVVGHLVCQCRMRCDIDIFPSKEHRCRLATTDILGDKGKKGDQRAKLEAVSCGVSEP